MNFFELLALMGPLVMGATNLVAFTRRWGTKMMHPVQLVNVVAGFSVFFYRLAVEVKLREWSRSDLFWFDFIRASNNAVIGVLSVSGLLCAIAGALYSRQVKLNGG